jgi:hypothetical protein
MSMRSRTSSKWTIVAPPWLGLVEGRVGLGEEAVGLVAGPQGAEPDARGHALLAEGGVQALRDDAGAVRVRAEDERELVAADAVRAVAGADVVEDRGRAAQQRVAVRMAVAIVEELEVVEVDRGDGERLAVTGGGRGLALEVVAEGALVREVGEPVAARAAQGDAMAAHERAPADEVEDERGAEEGGDDEHGARAAYGAALAVEQAVVARDLEGVAAVGERHRDDEVEVAAVGPDVGVAAGVGAPVAQRGVDAGVGLLAPDRLRVACDLDDVVGPDHLRLEDAGAAGDRLEQLLDLLVLAGGGARALPRLIEALRVAAVLDRVGLDEAALQLVADEDVPGNAEQREGQRDRDGQAQREAERRGAVPPPARVGGAQPRASVGRRAGGGRRGGAAGH